MRRRDFVKYTGEGLTLGLLATTVPGCLKVGDGIPTPDAGPSTGSADSGTSGGGSGSGSTMDGSTGSGSDTPMLTCTMTATIAGNHTTPHTITVPDADVNSTEDKTYTLTENGAMGHSHTVPVTAAQFQTLRDDGMVVIPFTDSHNHDITLSCPVS